MSQMLSQTFSYKISKKLNLIQSYHLGLHSYQFLKMLIVAVSLTNRCKLFDDLFTQYTKVLVTKLFLVDY